MEEVGSLLGTAENLTKFLENEHLQNFATKMRYLRQNFVAVNFCNTNVTFTNTRYPKYPIIMKIFWVGFGYC